MTGWCPGSPDQWEDVFLPSHQTGTLGCQDSATGRTRSSALAASARRKQLQVTLSGAKAGNTLDVPADTVTEDTDPRASCLLGDKDSVSPPRSVHRATMRGNAHTRAHTDDYRLPVSWVAFWVRSSWEGVWQTLLASPRDTEEINPYVSDAFQFCEP